MGLRTSNRPSILLTFALLNYLQLITATDILSFPLYGLETLSIQKTKDKSLGDAYRNYQLLDYDASVVPYLPNRGIGVFANVSYANLFLQVSFDQSLFFLVSEKCINCKHRLYNTSHSVTAFVYNYESDECWSNLFTIENNTVAECLATFHYGDSEVSGKVGYESIYLSASSSIITISNIIFLTYQQTEIFSDDIQGIVGIGHSDIEGVYGKSLLENLLDEGAINAAIMMICVDNRGNGSLTLGARLKDNQINALWTSQRSPFYYYFNVEKFTFGDMVVEKPLKASITITHTYVYLSDWLYQQFKKQLVGSICIAQGQPQVVEKLCNLVDKMMIHMSRAKFTKKDLEFLSTLPTPSITLIGDENQKETLRIPRLFGICDDSAQSFNKDVFHGLNDENEIDICIWVMKNNLNKDDIVLGNVINSENGTMYYFDKENGRMGFVQNHKCENVADILVVASFSFAWFILQQMVIVLVLAVLLIASLNKCDEYFYEDVDSTLDEGVSTLNLTHSFGPGNSTQLGDGQSQNQIESHDDSNSVDPNRQDESELQNVSSVQMG